MRKGFTLIEVIVGTALILIVFLGIFGAYQLGLKVVGLSKNKIIATAIANQKIEEIRNLPYQSIGTIGGFPSGTLPASATTLRNNIQYTINTRVDFVVDPADGIVPPQDECPNDYKRAEIKVSWSGLFRGQVAMVTDVAPKNLAQECAIAGGILAVSVFDAYGVMVPSPLIEIKDPITGTILKTTTPATGKHYFSLAASTYKIAVSKSGYSSEETFGSGDSFGGKIIITPDKPHPIVLEGQLTEISFSIDRLSALSIETLDATALIPIPDATFNLRGTKIVGKDSEENPIYKYSITASTDAKGNKYLPNLEWDSYIFSVDPATGLDLIDTAPSPQPIGLPPNTTLAVKLYLRAENSLLLTVQDIETLEPIFSAAVRLYNLGLGHDKTQYTNEKGQTYFIPLARATYNLEIQAVGYSAASTTVSVVGDTAKTIKLKRIE